MSAAAGRPVALLALGLATLTIVAAAAVGWAALGPMVTKACNDPSLRPTDPDWSLVETNHGVFSTAGDIYGSSLRWRRDTSAGPWTLQLFVYASSSPEGELPVPAPTVEVRGAPATVEPIDGYPPEDGPGYVVSWREGLLGCTYYSLRLNGAGVSQADLLAAAADLR